ncbi:hypothetical protein Taro_020946 [Colocasia esculenta]|uniref:Prenyltransferase alpha-alpha toroid domain-containing protein n=1 Tax=Colocasia esculenta TaxID=4460 RepID=A0A843UXN9_COLES|nr:hypothetical protein [Colocasia esculenta]
MAETGAPMDARCRSRSSSSSSGGAGDGSSFSSSAPPQRRLTVTQRDQLGVEAKVFEILRSLNGASPQTRSIMLELWRDKHIEFLTKGLKHLGPSFCVLDANRPWLCYWILHSLALLGDSVDSELEDNVVDFLSRCQDSEGGYGGGPGQLPHLATTYAAVNSLITLGNERALSSINRVGAREGVMRDGTDECAGVGPCPASRPMVSSSLSNCCPNQLMLSCRHCRRTAKSVPLKADLSALWFWPQDGSGRPGPGHIAVVGISPNIWCAADRRHVVVAKLV